MATIIPKTEAADWTVPHTNFQLTADGFQASFNNMPEALHRYNAGLVKSMNGAKGIAAIFQGLLVLFLLMVGMMIRLICFAFPTVIAVDSEHITISRKRLLRRDFGSFSVSHTLQDGEKTYGVLGYSYGNRTFSFGGLWTDRQATEVASALNSYLRKTPEASAIGRTSPDELRAARPTDF